MNEEQSKDWFLQEQRPDLEFNYTNYFED